jgi:long-subunit acyl-CoA synthetase (AMP-forming)
MLSHDNLTWTAHCLYNQFPELGADYRVVSYLPLSHIASQMTVSCSTFCLVVEL